MSGDKKIGVSTTAEWTVSNNHPGEKRSVINGLGWRSHLLRHTNSMAV